MQKDKSDIYIFIPLVTCLWDYSYINLNPAQ